MVLEQQVDSEGEEVIKGVSKVVQETPARNVGSVIILATVYKLVPPTWWAIGEEIPLIQMVDEKVCLPLKVI